MYAGISADGRKPSPKWKNNTVLCWDNHHLNWRGGPGDIWFPLLARMGCPISWVIAASDHQVERLIFSTCNGAIGAWSAFCWATIQAGHVGVSLENEMVFLLDGGSAAKGNGRGRLPPFPWCKACIWSSRRYAAIIWPGHRDGARFSRKSGAAEKRDMWNFYQIDVLTVSQERVHIYINIVDAGSGHRALSTGKGLRLRWRKLTRKAPCLRHHIVIYWSFCFSINLHCLRYNHYSPSWGSNPIGTFWTFTSRLSSIADCSIRPVFDSMYILCQCQIYSAKHGNRIWSFCLYSKIINQFLYPEVITE